MQYWKKVFAGNYKIYSYKLYELFNKEYKNHFYYVNDFWNPVNDNTKKNISKIIPEFQEVIKIFGSIKEIAILVLNSDSSTLHIDHTSGLNFNVKARLNIPVLNCQGSITSFFNLKEFYNSYTVSKAGTKAWDKKLRDTLPPVSTVELIEPTILRTSEPHTVFCSNCNFPRISITISFIKDVVYILDQ